MNEYLMIGTVLKPQGLQGEVKIRSYASRIDCFAEWKTLYLKAEQGYEPISLKLHRLQDDFVYAQLGNCHTVEEAEKLRGRELYVDRAHATQPGKNACFIEDLIGCVAEDEEGQPLGTLTEVLQYGSVDTWVFRTPTGTLMAPALLSVFPTVDPEQKKILAFRDKLEEVAVRT